MCVSRSTFLPARCTRSPRPVRVTAKTSWPKPRKRAATSRHAQPPRHAPGTRTSGRELIPARRAGLGQRRARSASGRRSASPALRAAAPGHPASPGEDCTSSRASSHCSPSTRTHAHATRPSSRLVLNSRRDCVDGRPQYSPISIRTNPQPPEHQPRKGSVMSFSTRPPAKHHPPPRLAVLLPHGRVGASPLSRRPGRSSCHCGRVLCSALRRHARDRLGDVGVLHRRSYRATALP